MHVRERLIYIPPPTLASTSESESEPKSSAQVHHLRSLGVSDMELNPESMLDLDDGTRVAPLTSILNELTAVLVKIKIMNNTRREQYKDKITQHPRIHRTLCLIVDLVTRLIQKVRGCKRFNAPLSEEVKLTSYELESMMSGKQYRRLMRLFPLLSQGQCAKQRQKLSVRKQSLQHTLMVNHHRVIVSMMRAMIRNEAPPHEILALRLTKIAMDGSEIKSSLEMDWNGLGLQGFATHQSLHHLWSIMNSNLDLDESKIIEQAVARNAVIVWHSHMALGNVSKCPILVATVVNENQATVHSMLSEANISSLAFGYIPSVLVFDCGTWNVAGSSDFCDSSSFYTGRGKDSPFPDEGKYKVCSKSLVYRDQSCTYYIHVTYDFAHAVIKSIINGIMALGNKFHLYNVEQKKMVSVDFLDLVDLLIERDAKGLRKSSGKLELHKIRHRMDVKSQMMRVGTAASSSSNKLQVELAEAEKDLRLEIATDEFEQSEDRERAVLRCSAIPPLITFFQALNLAIDEGNGHDPLFKGSSSGGSAGRRAEFVDADSERGSALLSNLREPARMLEIIRNQVERDKQLNTVRPNCTLIVSVFLFFY